MSKQIDENQNKSSRTALKFDGSDSPSELALHYCRLGWPVMLVGHNKAALREWSKGPMDESEIVLKCREFPNPQVSIICGATGGVMALDLDVEKDAEGNKIHGAVQAAIAKLGAWETECGLPLGHVLDSMVVSESPSGGRHVFLQWPEGVTNSTRFGEGVIDVRAQGGLIPAPGARRPDGSGVYRFIGDSTAILRQPLETVRAMLPKVEAKHLRKPEDIEREIRSRHGPTLELKLARTRAARQDDRIRTRQDKWLLRKFDERVADVVAAPSTGHRNEVVKTSAYALGRFLHYGTYTENEAYDAIAMVIHSWPTIDHREMLRTLRRALTRGMQDANGIIKLEEREQSNVVPMRRAASGGDGGGQPGDPGPSRSDGEPSLYLTNDHVAEAYAQRRSAHTAYVEEIDRWRRWTDTEWSEISTHLVRQEMAAMIRSSEHAKEKHLSNRWIDGCERVARGHKPLRKGVMEWDRDGLLTGTPNGVLDCRTGEMLPPRPEYLITRRALVSPDASMPTPIFDRSFNEMTGSDESLKTYLLRYFGSCLTGDTRDQVVLFLVGEGGTGKGTLMRLIEYILGDYAGAIDTDKLTRRATVFSKDIAMASLIGKRLAVLGEADENEKLAGSTFKAVSGRDRVTARIGNNNISYRPEFKLVMMTNHAPVIGAMGSGERRRIRIVPFDHIPKKPDLMLDDKLRAEAPGVMAKLVAACVEWQAEGLVTPEVVVRATEKFFQEQDHVGMWAADYVKRAPGAYVPSGAVYKVYRTWFEEMFPRETCMSEVKFAEAMKGKGYEKKRSGGMKYIGIGVLGVGLNEGGFQ